MDQWGKAIIIFALVSWASASHAITSVHYQGVPIELSINPYFRSTLIFPKKIKEIKVTFAKDGLGASFEGHILTIAPVNWPPGDTRFELRNVITVLLDQTSNIYQINFRNDFTVTDHVYQIHDHAVDSYTRKDEERKQELMIRFIKNQGQLDETQRISLPPLQLVHPGLELSVERSYRAENMKLVYGHVSIKEDYGKSILMNEANIDSLMIQGSDFLYRRGQCFFPGFRQMLMPEEAYPVFYFYQD